MGLAFFVISLGFFMGAGLLFVFYLIDIVGGIWTMLFIAGVVEAWWFPWLLVICGLCSLWIAYEI